MPLVVRPAAAARSTPWSTTSHATDRSTVPTHSKIFNATSPAATCSPPISPRATKCPTGFPSRRSWASPMPASRHRRRRTRRLLCRRIPRISARRFQIYPDPPNLHWGLVLLIGCFTCGLFLIVWMFVQAAWMRKVDPRSKALTYYIVAIAVYVVMMVAEVALIFAASKRKSRRNLHVGGLSRLARSPISSCSSSPSSPCAPISKSTSTARSRSASS